MNTNPPISRKDNLVIQEMPNEVMIYDLNDNKAFCLDQTSALVWQSCDGKKSITEITKTVSRELDSEVNEAFVWLALDQLKKENLIENEVEMPKSVEGKSRRQIIKEIGLGTMIALPIVASLIAPSSVLAQSCLMLLANCTPAPNLCCPTGMNCINTTSPSAGQCCSGTGVNIPGPAGGSPFTFMSPPSVNVCGGPAGPGGPFPVINSPLCGPDCCTGMGNLTGCVSAGGAPAFPLGGNDTLTCICT